MMPRIALLALALLAACADPDPRDRSLARRGETFPVHPDVYVPRESIPVRPPPAAASNVGLEVDELAPLYPADARLVIRCADLKSLDVHARGRLASLAAVLPDWKLPELPPGTLLRVNCVIPDEVVIDRSHPFAFAQTGGGWVVLLPIPETFTETEFLRRINDRYCAAGSQEALEAYAPGGRSGHYLRGDVSVSARGDAVPELGRRLTEAGAALGVNLPRIAELPGTAFAGIERVDLALHCLESTVRADLRIVPSAEQAPALTTLVGTLDARTGRAADHIPDNGTITVTAHSDVASLLTMASQFGATQPGAIAPARTAALQKALGLLGDDAAVSLHFDDDARATLRLVAELTEPDRRAIRKFLGSEGWDAMLAEFGGDGHTFAYEPSAVEHAGIPVATVSGSPSTPMLTALKACPGLGAPLARLFGGEDRIRIALVGNRLCVTVGEDARGAIVSMIDRMIANKQGEAARVNALRKGSLMEGSFDAAALLSLAREETRAAAPRRVPVDFAVATEGDALRLTIRLPLARIAEQWSEPDPQPSAPAEPASPARD